eukprot:jgi/Astpho2/3058/e_gw1.00051.159.1_t
MQVQLSQMDTLPPTFQKSASSQEDLAMAREALELAVIVSLKMQDDAAFERNFLQLRTYYTDTRGVLPESPQENNILGLNLLRLLVQNRIAEFHTELELIPQQAHQSPYIRHATQLEQWLMEGAYNKVLGAKSSAPDAAYATLMERLVSTVRDEIASCSERAYSSLSIVEAKKLMLVSSDAEALKYADQRGWRVQGSTVTFDPEQVKATRDLPAKELISNALTYARELERIV